MTLCVFCSVICTKAMFIVAITRFVCVLHRQKALEGSLVTKLGSV